ncbi:MAG TPA: GrpB family protein [Clostridiales bacterium]|nr:GrpB family protein [Clostridiales bacterium]
MKIEIVTYNPDWAKKFEAEKTNLLHLFGSHAKAVEHIGSTAIPGQRAKPVIDIFVGVSPFEELSFYQHVFNPREYRHTPTDMTGRYLFAKYKNGTWTHNIHILPYHDGFYLRNEFLLRDYLKEHPKLSDEYGAVKERAAMENGSTIEAYTRAKTEFI